MALRAGETPRCPRGLTAMEAWRRSLAVPALSLCTSDRIECRGLVGRAVKDGGSRSRASGSAFPDIPADGGRDSDARFASEVIAMRATWKSRASLV